MVSKSKDHRVSYWLSKLVVLTSVPVINCISNFSIDRTIVPKQVVWDPLSEKGGVSEDGEEVSEASEVIRDSSTVVNCGRKIL